MVLESGKITAEGVESLRKRLGSFNRPRQYGVGLSTKMLPAAPSATSARA